MKKKYLTYAGIISALVLAGMFIAICLSPVPAPLLLSGTTFDPITGTSIDENNMLVVTGTTPLQSEYTFFDLRISPEPPATAQGNISGTTPVRGSAWLNSRPGGRNLWKGFVNISSLEPGDYTISLVTYNMTKQGTLVYSDPIATQHFTLHDERAGAGTLRKKIPAVQLFIRVNTPGRGPAADGGTIDGITSLAPGTPLAWSMLAAGNGTGTDLQEYRGTTQVVPGTGGINRWSVAPGNGTPAPARYRFHIADAPGGTTSPAGTISSLAEFDLPRHFAPLQNTSGSAPLPPYITIDALPAIRTNGMYVVSGTTSLPSGENLRFTIEPVTFETNYTVAFDRQEKNPLVEFSGVCGGTDVVNGSSGYNLWSGSFATYNLRPGEWEVNVSRNTLDPVTLDLVPGTLFTAQRFTIES